MAQTYLWLIGLLMGTVLLIVTSHRLEIEKKYRFKYGVDREWWLPILTLSIAILTDLIKPDLVFQTFTDKIGIILLIFTFGLLAEGLAESKVFKYLSITAVNYCNSNTRQLLVSLFIITSIVTLITTNDIVVLVMTPILIDIAYRAKLENMKLLLLSQFIAANTLSMGLLIGSPTNIIIAETLNIGFINYAGLMVGVAITSALISLFVLIFIYEIAEKTRFFNSYSLSETYETPDFEKPTVTKPMKIWSCIFVIFVILVTIVTELQYSLIWCSVPTIIICVGYWVSTNTTGTVRKPLKSLPYGVFFFGISFFTFASAIGDTSFILNEVYPIIQTHLQNPPLSIPFGIAGTGLLVNIFNDLPAAALIADFLSVHFESLNIIILQAILVGLNIGAYVTQIGALAGIIWFNQIRIYKKRYSSSQTNITTPSRIDLVKYGLLNFFTVTIFISFILFIELQIINTIF